MKQTYKEFASLNLPNVKKNVYKYYFCLEVVLRNVRNYMNTMIKLSLILDF